MERPLKSQFVANEPDKTYDFVINGSAVDMFRISAFYKKQRTWYVAYPCEDVNGEPVYVPTSLFQWYIAHSCKTGAERVYVPRRLIK